jgi:hypothetical protein
MELVYVPKKEDAFTVQTVNASGQYGKCEKINFSVRRKGRFVHNNKVAYKKLKVNILTEFSKRCLISRI